jgi:hypothetical protein
VEQVPEAVADGPCARLRSVEALEGVTPFAEEHLSGQGEAGALVRPQEQDRAEVTLHLADGAAQGRLSHEEPGRGARETSFFCHGDEVAQLS